VCGPIKFEDIGFNIGITWHGCHAVFCDNAVGSNWGNLLFECIYAKNVVSAFTAAGPVTSVDRIRGIKINKIFADNCYYGVNFQNSGDHVVIDQLYFFAGYRAYFVYGVTDHKVRVSARNNLNTSACINICREAGGLDTKSIHVEYTARNAAAGITHVLIDHVDLLGGTISDVKVHLDIEQVNTYTPLRFVNYTGSGGTETAAASSNLVKDIEISGTCDAQAFPITSVASYGTNTGRLTFHQGDHLTIDQTFFSKFFVETNQTVTTYTPVWTSTGTTPSLGNGALSGYYSVYGNVVLVEIDLTIGSTTSLGTGQYSFSLPLVPGKSAVGSFYILRPGIQVYSGSTYAPNGTGTMSAYPNASGAGVGAANPAAWTAGDTMKLQVSYPMY
jgi:hypothetical protein